MPPKCFDKAYQKARRQAQIDTHIEPPSKRPRDDLGLTAERCERAATVVDSRDALALRLGAVAESSLEACAEQTKPVHNGHIRVSNEALVDAINAVVLFSDLTGSVTVIASQASDVAYLLSDTVFWSLFRRLAAEISALEVGATAMGDALWASLPGNSEDVVSYAEMQGYVLPTGLAVPTADSCWRHAFLNEVATDLMLARLQAGRGFVLPALSGPPVANHWEWMEKPEGCTEGLASNVCGEGDEPAASKLMEDMEEAVSVSVDLAAPCALQDRLSRLSLVMGSEQSRPSNSATAMNGLSLQGGWSVQQEEDIHLIALALQDDYSLRRQILLRRLDVTLQALHNSENFVAEEVQRRAAKVLSEMWAGWRRNASDAPLLSKWNALAASCAQVSKAIGARVSCPHVRVSSTVKSFRMTAQVPDRGGVPEAFASEAMIGTLAPGSAARANFWTNPTGQAHLGGGHVRIGSVRSLPESWYSLGLKRARGS